MKVFKPLIYLTVSIFFLSATSLYKKEIVHTSSNFEDSTSKTYRYKLKPGIKESSENIGKTNKKENYEGAPEIIEKYYNRLSPKSLDSAKTWLLNYSLLDENIELIGLLDFFGDYFYRIDKIKMTDSLFTCIKFGSDFKNLTYSNWHDKLNRYDKGYSNPITENFYKKNIPKLNDVIWDDQSLILNVNKELIAFWLLRNSNQDIAKEIASLSSEQIQGRFPTIENLSKFNSTIDKIKSLPFSNNTNELLYLTCLKLYSIGCYDSIPNILFFIDKNSKGAKKVNNEFKAKWCVAISKMLLTVNIETYSNISIFYIIRARSFLKNDKNAQSSDLGMRLELMHAEIWNYQLVNTNTAKYNLKILYQSYHNNKRELKIGGRKRLISQIIAALGNFYTSIDIEGKTIDPNLLLRQALLSYYYYMYYHENEFSIDEINALQGLATYYHLMKKPEIEQTVNYILLTHLTSDVSLKNKVMGRVYSIMYNYFSMRDTLNGNLWKKYLESQEFDKTFVVTMTPSFENLNEEEYKNSRDLLLETNFTEMNSLPSISRYLIFAGARRTLGEYSSKEAINQRWESAYKLLKKRDDISLETSSDYYFNMGNFTSLGVESVIIDNLNDEKKELSEEIKIKRTEISKLDNTIRTKDSILWISKTKLNITDALLQKEKRELSNTLDLLNKRKRELAIVNLEVNKQKATIIGLRHKNTIAFIVILIFALATFTIYSLYAIVKKQRKKLHIESNRNLYKSSMQYFDRHFISNITVKIKSCIRNNMEAAANQLIDDFTTLNREILKFGSQDNNTLYEDIEFTKKYLDLNTKIIKGLNYTISYPENWETIKDIKYPFGLTQIFCENSIDHGLFFRGNSYDKKLELEITKQANILKILIKDNGVGRVVAAQRRAENNQHISYGTEIAYNKAKAFNVITPSSYTFLYKDDPINKAGECLGTIVDISNKLP